MNVFPLLNVEFDYIECTYDGSGNCVRATYKINGATGTTVAVLTMTYDGSGNVLTVTKTDH
jgi:hypothetical protein